MKSCDRGFLLMNEQKLMSLLGLAQKAGKVSSGELAVETAIRSGKAKLLLVACDASANTQKGYHDLARHYQVECYVQLTKEQLGRCTGKAQRAALAVTDSGFCAGVKKILTSTG